MKLYGIAKGTPQVPTESKAIHGPVHDWREAPTGGLRCIRPRCTERREGK